MGKQKNKELSMKKRYVLVLLSVLIVGTQLARGHFAEIPPISSTEQAGHSAPQITVLERTTEPLLVSDKPWEDFEIDYVNVIKIGKTWHMWYLAYDSHYKYDSDAYLCYARSTDGVRWEKPNLGFVYYNGSKSNNILLDGPKMRANATTVFLDEHAPPDQRFKMLLQFLQFDAQDQAIWQNTAAVSPDGLHWKLLPKPIYPWNSDTQNAAFWDQGRYRMYVRLWRGVDKQGKTFVTTESTTGAMRTIGLTESTNFTAFPKAKEILAPDSSDPPDLQFYGSASSKLRDNLYVFFISCYYTKEDLIRIQPAFSRDGKTFHRLGRQPILDLGKGFDSKAIYVAPGGIPGDEPNTYWFYYFGSAVQHDKTVPENVQHGGGIGRFLVKITD
jgi:hypothetical protein